MEDKKNKIYISAPVIFWIIFASFILLEVLEVMLIFVPTLAKNNFVMMFGNLSFFALFFPLGIALIVLAAKAHFTKISKSFFILKGSSALCIAVSIIQPGPGEGYYPGRIGAIAEWAFFILERYVCPIALLVGVVGSIVLIAKKRIIA